jgi:hypothetical protein
MSRDSERQKKKYAEDPVFRAKRLAYNAAYRKSHKEEIKAQRQSRKQDPVYAEKARARERELNRKNNIKKKYGITLEDYDAMVARQGGKCKICRKKPKELLFVDHCHAFLAIRGLLCRGCNCMLGFAKDNPAVLEEGRRYLRNFLRKMRRLLGGGIDRKPFYARRRSRYRPRIAVPRSLVPVAASGTAAEPDVRPASALHPPLGPPIPG